MSIVRLVRVSAPANQACNVEEVWRRDCKRLLIQSSGCFSEHLLKRVGISEEYISYSEWSSEDAIGTYLRSDAYKSIQASSREILGATSFVNVYKVID